MVDIKRMTVPVPVVIAAGFAFALALIPAGMNYGALQSRVDELKTQKKELDDRDAQRWDRQFQFNADLIAHMDAMQRALKMNDTPPMQRYGRAPDEPLVSVQKKQSSVDPNSTTVGKMQPPKEQISQW
jgi:hypothetical protein